MFSVQHCDWLRKGLLRLRGAERAPHCLGNWYEPAPEQGPVRSLGIARSWDGAGNRAEVTDGAFLWTAERNYKYNILRHGKRVSHLWEQIRGEYVDGIIIKLKKFDKNDSSWSPKETELASSYNRHWSCAHLQHSLCVAEFVLSLLVYQTCCHSTHFILSNSPNNPAE